MISLHAEVRLRINQHHTLESQGQGRVLERQRSWPGPKAALLGAARMQHLRRYITRPATPYDYLPMRPSGSKKSITPRRYLENHEICENRKRDPYDGEMDESGMNGWHLFSLVSTVRYQYDEP